MKRIIIPVFVVVILALGSSLAYVLTRESSATNEEVYLTDWALTPDNHLIVANRDLKMATYNASVHEINKAIRQMRTIEVLGKPEDMKLVEEAIDHLLNVEEEIKMRNVDPVKLEEASIESLNALALIHLRMSEWLAKQGSQEKAMKSIRIAIKHLQNAVDLAHLGSQRVGERLVIGELQILLDSLEQYGHMQETEYTISANDLIKLIKDN